MQLDRRRHAAGFPDVRVHTRDGCRAGAAVLRREAGFHPKEEVAGGVVYGFRNATACFLYPTPNAGTSKASQAFWQVDDIERKVAALKARGVTFEDYDMPGEKSPSGVITSGGAKAAWFKDTEGNMLAIIQNAA
jgi:hypothetical protein